jgi:hypothetical protein
MRQNIIRFIVLVFVAITTQSCSNKLTPFTKRLQNQFEWSESELQRIQFYLSEDIVLRRTLGIGESRITDGKIKVVDGREVEQVVFKEGTPGVLLFSPKQNRLAISFEEDSERFLMFGPNPQAGGKYVLLAKDWDKRVGQVSYNGKTYNTTSQSALSCLMVDLDKHRELDYKSETVGGRKVK